MQHPKYRPDIDGLRAFAVLSVVFYHAAPNVLRGGFVGVDIFFVISGYLISTIIIKSLAQGDFSVREFYGRRVKRIFPGLSLVILATLVFGWASLQPEEYKQLGLHALSGSGFFSNITLWLESGYFDNASETKPLLHLWSLGVEEQFYIVWPLFLIFFVSSARRGGRWILLLAVCSFILNVVFVGKYQSGVFFLPVTRFWELLVGSLLAWASLHSKKDVKQFSSARENILSLAGLVILVISVWKIKGGQNFPGWWAAMPVLGAAMIIRAGPSAWGNKRILSANVVVWFGLISFPLYLWHWPLLSFANILEGRQPSAFVRVVLVGVSVLLAWLTYRYVERPIRQKKDGNFFVILFSIFVFVIGLLGLTIYIQDGFPSRSSPVSVMADGDIGHEQYFDYWSKIYYECENHKILAGAPRYGNIARCMQSKKNHPINIVVIGDSHAEHLFTGLAYHLSGKNVAYYLQSDLPLYDRSKFKVIIDEAIRDKNVKVVILAAFWSRRFNEMPKDYDLVNAVERTVRKLEENGKRVVLVNNVPSFPFSPTRCSQIRRFSSGETTCDISLSDVETASSRSREVFQTALSLHASSVLIDASQYFCREGRCSMKLGNDLLYRDNRHLNIKGSQYLGAMLANDLQWVFN